MNAKEFLMQAVWADRHVQTCINELELLRMQRGNIGGQLGGDGVHAPGGLPHSRVEDLALRIVGMEDKLLAEAEKWQATYEQVRGVIDQVQVLNQRDLLMRRYLCGQRWEDIREALSTERFQPDLRTIHRWHGAALESVQNILDQ